MGQVTESIYECSNAIIPLAEVQYMEKDKRANFIDGVNIILSGTTWNDEIGGWNNSPYLRGDEAKGFRKAWCRYRHELEKETLADLTLNT